MTSFWEEILRTVGTAAVIVAATAWLAQRVVVHLLSKDVEGYKIRLQSEFNAQIEELKSRLQSASEEQRIRFSSLHEKRRKLSKRCIALWMRR
jgi:hypothetical protein